MEKPLIMNIIVQTQTEVDEILSSDCCDRVEDSFYALVKKLSDGSTEFFRESPELKEYEEYQNSLLKLIEYSVDKGVKAAAKSLAFMNAFNPSLTYPSS